MRTFPGPWLTRSFCDVRVNEEKGNLRFRRILPSLINIRSSSMEANIEHTIFEKYLLSIKIDSARFRREQAEEWNSLRHEFEIGGEKSFFLRKRFLLNPLRLEYPQSHEK